MPLKVFQDRTANRTLAIAAGKGGVGKSTFTVLLASALKRMGEKVGVLDADLYGPSIRSLLPEEIPPKQEGNQLIPAWAKGMKVLSMAFFQQEASIRAPLANQMIMHFLKSAVWGPLDWLLIDFPPGRGDIPLTAIQQSALSGALLVTTPQQTAAIEVLQAARLFQKMGVPIIGIVENMSYFGDPSCTPFGAGAARLLAHKIGAPCLGQIPLDPALSEKGDRGTLADMELPVVKNIAQQLKEGFLEDADPISALSFPDSKTLRIEWRNSEKTHLKAALLQKNCPCAQCQKGREVKEDVSFNHFERIGRYALKFDFSLGCCYGIYPFDLLKKIGS